MPERIAAAARRAGDAPLAAWIAVACVAGLASASLGALAPPAALALALLAVAGTFLVVVSARPEAGLVALVGAAALDTVGRITEVGGAPITLYQLTAAAMVAVLFWKIAVLRSDAFPSSGVDLPVLVFVAAGAAALLSAPDPLRGAVTLASLVSSAVLLYVTVHVVRSGERARLIVWGVLLLAAILGVLAVAERLGVFSIQPFLKTTQDGIRARVTFKDPNIFASFLVCAACFGVPLALSRRRWMGGALAWGAVAAVCAGLAATLSRGAWIAFVAGMLVVLVAARVPMRTKALLVALAFGAGFVVATRVLDPQWVAAKVLGFAQNASFLYRIYMGESAVRMAVDHPFGVGPGNYPLLFPLYRNAFVGAGLVESHNAYLTVLAEMGFVGLAAFVWLLAATGLRTLRAAMRLPDGEMQVVAVGALAAGVALATQSLTYSLEASKFLWLTVGLGLAAARALRSGEEA